MATWSSETREARSSWKPSTRQPASPSAGTTPAVEPVAGNSMLVEFTRTPEGAERTRLRVTETGHELLAWPDAEKQRYADEHQGGWGEVGDRLATLLAKR